MTKEQFITGAIVIVDHIEAKCMKHTSVSELAAIRETIAAATKQSVVNAAIAEAKMVLIRERLCIVE